MPQQLGADLGDTGTLPSPDRLAAAALARDVLPALTLSLLFLTPSLYIMCAAEIFAPVFLHPLENCVDFSWLPALLLPSLGRCRWEGSLAGPQLTADRAVGSRLL